MMEIKKSKHIVFQNPHLIPIVGWNLVKNTLKMGEHVIVNFCPSKLTNELNN